MRFRWPMNFLRVSIVFFLSTHFFTQAQSPADWPAPRTVDLDRAAAAGLREIAGTHLRLWTDMPPGEAVDELPQVFDAAIPVWEKYFGVPHQKVAPWQVQGFLIRDRAKFAALGLLPNDNPNFINGYALGNELWFEEQPSDYYRRHLLLHEGTHSFMLSMLGGAGPGWYMEGMAELLGTHHWQERLLELRVFPASKEDVPMWGRIPVIRQAVAEDRQLSLGEVMSISNREALSVDAYAWCWALAQFLDSHPEYSEPFGKLKRQVQNPEFNERFRRLFHKDWDDLEFNWQAYLHSLDYGYDPQRMAVGQAIPHENYAEIVADRGWQQLPGKLRRGQTYRIISKGRFDLARDGETWPSEPNGVTLEYHDSHPLGMLLGTLRSEKHRDEFAKPIEIGLRTTITPEDDSILYLRLNNWPGELSRSKGSVAVKVEPVTTGD